MRTSHHACMWPQEGKGSIYFLIKARKSKDLLYQKLLGIVYQYFPSACCALGTVLAARNATAHVECLLPGQGGCTGQRKELRSGDRATGLVNPPLNKRIHCYILFF